MRNPIFPQTFFKLADKNSGVEPGFIAASLQDVVFLLEEAFPNREERLNYYHSQGGANAQEMYAQAQKKYLMKHDVTSTFGLVVPRNKDLKPAKHVQAMYDRNPLLGNLCLIGFKLYKTNTPAQKYSEAVSEVLANDLARASGMNVQEQTLIKTTYEDGSPKLMLKGKWLCGAETLEGHLAGGKSGQLYHQYYLTPTLYQPDGIKYLADDSIDHLASYYATLLVQDDYDAKRSELMEGLLIYAKLEGLPNWDNVLKHYSPAVCERIKQIKTGSIKQIFKDYMERFEAYASSEPLNTNIIMNKSCQPFSKRKLLRWIP